MTLDLGERPANVSWYLIARNGDMVARVVPGLRLGEDRTGELSFKPKHASVQLDVDQEGGLIVRAVSQVHELEVAHAASRLVSLSPETPARISFGNNSLSIRTDFATAEPATDPIEIDVVRTSVVRPLVRGLKAALGPSRGTSHSDARARAVVKVDPQTGAAPGDAPRGRTAALAPIAAPPRRASAVTDAGPRRVGVRASVASVVAAVAAFTSVLLGLALYFAVGESDRMPGVTPPADSTDRITEAAAPAPRAGDGMEVGAPPASARSGFISENSALLDMVSAVVASERLPDKATVDLALQSLKALRVAYPDEPNVRRSLEELTVRLADGAKRSFADGDAFTAGRLIEQAASTGVARPAVTEALAFFASAQQGPVDDDAEAEVRPLDILAQPAPEPERRPDSSEPPQPPPAAPMEDAGDASTVASAAPHVEPVAPTQLAEEPVEPLADAMQDDTPADAIADEPPDDPIADEPPADAMADEPPADAIADEPTAGAVEDEPADAMEDVPTTAAANAPADSSLEEAVQAYRLAKEGQSATAPTDAADAAIEVDWSALVDDLNTLAADPSASAAPPVSALALLDAAEQAPTETPLSPAQTSPAQVPAQTSPAQMPAQTSPLPAQTSDESASRGDVPAAPPHYALSELTIIDQPAPSYPRRVPAGASGSVDLALTISETGEVSELDVIGNAPIYFSLAARRAVAKWRFEPVIENGGPVSVRTEVRVTFRPSD